MHDGSALHCAYAAYAAYAAHAVSRTRGLLGGSRTWPVMTSPATSPVRLRVTLMTSRVTSRDVTGEVTRVTGDPTGEVTREVAGHGSLEPLRRANDRSAVTNGGLQPLVRLSIEDERRTR